MELIARPMVIFAVQETANHNQYEAPYASSHGSVALLGVMLLALAWIEAAPQLPKAKNDRKSAATTASYGNADAITADELKEYEYFLASDELEGRYQPSRGYNVARLSTLPVVYTNGA